MYLAEFIHSFRHKDREDYEPSGFTCLVSSHERCFYISENLSDDLVRVKLRVRERLCLIDLSNFQIRTRIEHYTARIDCNQDLFIYPFLNILS